MNMTSLSVSEAVSLTKPLLYFILGIVIYAIFIFKFYRFVARKDIFPINLQQYSNSFVGAIANFFKFIFYIIEYMIVFPFLAFFWFAVISLILILISKSHPVSQILLIAMALVASIRVTSYYNENLSQDLAKMFPFALLGVFLLDISTLSFQASFETLKSIPSMWKHIIYYFAFTVVLELVLRITHPVIKPAFDKKK